MGKMQKKDAEKSRTLYVGIEGMFCDHCYETVSSALATLDGVESVSFLQTTAKMTGKALPDAEAIIYAVRNAGYETDSARIRRSFRETSGRALRLELPILFAAIAAVWIIAKRFFGINLFYAVPTINSGMTYGMLFAAGLLTGVHCMGMCGAIGLYASSDSGDERSFKRPLLYNLGRVVSYTAIGGIVGLIGSVISFGNTLRGVVILLAAAAMFLMSLSMLGVFRFHLPRLFPVHVRSGNTGALVIGLLNGFMPCGPLQAMQLYALSSGGFLTGALSMLLFALGTVPLMLGSGMLLNSASGKTKAAFGKAAAVLILVLSVSMFGRGLAAFGVDLERTFSLTEDGYIPAAVENGVQTVSFELEYDAYADIVVQKNIPVRLTILADEKKITGCNSEVVSVDFGFDTVIKPGETVIEFLPDREGDYVYTCWMYMIRNHIWVVDDLSRLGG